MIDRSDHSLLPILGAAAVTAAAAPVVRAGLLASGIVDVPNARSSHQVPVPRGGGLACALGVVVAVAAAPSGMSGRELGCVGALTLTGLADDRCGLPAQVRLLAQGAAGAMAGSTSAGATLRGALTVPVAVNVVNFMDGVNGISGLTAVAWGLHARALLPASPQGASAAGAGLGFLPWNIPKARLFLGDSGSYLLGSLIGTLITRAEPRTALRLALPLAPYLLDATLTLARRAASGQDLLAAHREHAYQRLVHDQGWSHLQVAGSHALLVTVLARVSRQQSQPTATLVAVGLGIAWASAPELISSARRLRLWRLRERVSDGVRRPSRMS